MKKVIMAAVVVAMAAGTAFGAESVSKSVILHSNGTAVNVMEKVSTDGKLRRIERVEEATAGPGKGNKRLIYAEESGQNGKMAIREKAKDGRVAEAEGVYQRY